MEGTKKKKTLEEKQKQVFAAGMGWLDENEEDTDQTSQESGDVVELDVVQVNQKDDKDAQNGKILPTTNVIVGFRFFDEKVLLKQDTHSCGGHLWRSATVLLRYMENQEAFPKQVDGSHFWKGKRVIELGAGTGLLGIALAKIGSSVILTDQQSLVPLMRENARLNGIEDESMRIEELWWGSTDCSSFTSTPIDFIIASDCIYLEPVFGPLVETMYQLSNENTKIIMSFQKRRKADNRFWKIAQKKFNVTKVPPEVYSTKTERVNICFLTKKELKSKVVTNNVATTAILPVTDVSQDDPKQ